MLFCQPVGKILDKAKRQRQQAYELRHHPQRDFANVPCAKRVRASSQIVARIGSELGKTQNDIRRLNEKIHNQVTLKSPQAAIIDAMAAGNVLLHARSHLEAQLRAARNVRNWARRVCRRK